MKKSPEENELTTGQGLPAPICYAQALDLCAAGGMSPLCANLNPIQPKTINDVLEDLGGRLPPVPDDVAKALAITTIYSLETIRKSFA